MQSQLHFDASTISVHYLVKDLERNYLTVLPVTIEKVMARKHMQEALEEAERRRILMEAAGAAAHEINQPLQVISIESETRLMEMAPDDPARRPTENVIEAVDRISEILLKMKNIHRYATMPYDRGSNIVDLDLASREEGERL